MSDPVELTGGGIASIDIDENDVEIWHTRNTCGIEASTFRLLMRAIDHMEQIGWRTVGSFQKVFPFREMAPGVYMITMKKG